MNSDLANETSSRKRSRTLSPNQSASRPNGHTQAEEARHVKQLKDSSSRNAVLNEILKLSFSHESNFVLPSDLILKEFSEIVIYDCLDWKEPQTEDDTVPPSFRSKEAWTSPPTARMATWLRHCQIQLGPRRCLIDPEKMKTMEVILAILRNLSFVGGNLRLLAYSPDIIAVLVGCLYEGTDQVHATAGDEISSGGSSTMTLAWCALQVLVHLAPYLDVSGQRLLSDRLFYSPRRTQDGPRMPNSSSFGQAVDGSWGFGGLWLAKRLDTKDDSVSDVSKEFLLTFTADYLVSLWSLFSALAYVLTHPKSTRPVIMMAVDLLQELINHARVGVVGSVQLDDSEDEIPTIRAVLVNMPDAVIERLTGLLYVPRLGPDSLDYVDPMKSIVTRVTTLKLLMGYDATVDTDVRDRALDVLVPLLELDSPRMAARLGRTESSSTRLRLYDAVLPILTTAVGRSEASVLAAQLLREISRAEENRVGLMYIQSRLMELASRDPRVSHLVWNHLYAPALEAETESVSSALEAS